MLTGTHSEAASYEFTTLTCIPGIIHYNDTKIQLLDLPGIIEGASEGKGRGRQVKEDLLVSFHRIWSPVYLTIDESEMSCKLIGLIEYFHGGLWWLLGWMVLYNFSCLEHVGIKTTLLKSSFFSQVIAVSKSSDIVLMVLDASKVSVCLYSVLAVNPCDEWMWIFLW